MTQETKLGIFVLAGVAALILTIILLGDFQFQRSYALNILFDNVSGLPAKGKVKIAGVEVGGVKDIVLDDSHARVKVWIKYGVKIHADAQASIVSTGLIGSKYLELTTGSPDAPLLRDGDTIRGTESLSLEKMAQNIMGQIEKLVNGFQGPEGEDMGKNLAATLSNIRKISDSLREALAEQETKLVAIVDNIHSFSQDMADVTAQNKENLRIAIEKISDVALKMDAILAKVEKGEGTVGKLLSDQQMGEDLKSTVANLKETSKEANRALRRINLIETRWDYTLRYDTRNLVAHHDLGLRVYPRPGKFYFVGVSNAGRAAEGVADPEEMNTINFLIGKEFKMGQAYAGVIRSSGGLGVRVKPIWGWEPWRRLEFTVEGYNFFRKTPVAKPKYNLGARLGLTRWAYVGAQFEDPYHSSMLNTYVNVVFRDDDLAYILGLVGLARP